ncbi:MAG: sulfite exporter TauE/SafE family protein [Desulfobacterales bacterium]|nr:sulfite exporter TauE/SafE family protein [Desulfobacterales bacterium]
MPWRFVVVKQVRVFTKRGENVGHQPEVWQILLANVAVGIGALIQSGTGFGLGLVAVPLLILIDPVFAPGAFLVASLFQNIIMARRNYLGVRREWLSSIVPGLVAGTFFAFLVLRCLKGPGVELAIGVTILTAVMISAAGFTLKVTSRRLLSGASLAGVMGTLAGVPGPPLILLIQNERGEEIRANLALSFLVGGAFSIASLYFAGRFGMFQFCMGLSMIPGILLGASLGGRLSPFLDGPRLRPTLLLLVGLGGVALVSRNLMGW